jgi:protoporphyrin/coproporphyrin ferrochelatase
MTLSLTMQPCWSFSYGTMQQQKQLLLRQRGRRRSSQQQQRRRSSSNGLLRVSFKLGSTRRLDSVLLEAVAIPLDGMSSSSADAASPSKVGVLLLNLGGPETSADVEGFLYNLFADPDIIQLPPPLAVLQPLIAFLISKRRAPKSKAAYESIGGGSPILKYSREQARLLCEELKSRHGIDVSAYIGMRYWHPFTEEALEQIRRDNIGALVIVPLYPQFSISTSGSSLRVLQEEFSKFAAKYRDMVHTVVPSWFMRPGYVKAMARLIEAELDSFTDDQVRQALKETPSQPPLHVLCSAHGVPKSYVEAGDPYQKQIVECVAAIEAQLMKKYGADRLKVHLSYQSRVGPIEWLRPYTDDVLPALGEAGVRNLVVVPISFVSEHIETLEEIDIEYRELAEESGITNWRRCPALNTDPAFISDLADLVAEALEEPIQTVTEACVANMVANIEPEERLFSIAGVQGVGAEGALFKSSPSNVRLKDQERLNARIAMAGVLITILIELANGKSLVHMFGN